MIDLDFVWKLTLRDSDINEHLLTLYGLVVATKSRTVLEIGSGQSTFALTAAVNETKGELFSIDLTPELSSLRLYPEAKGLLPTEPRYHSIEGDSKAVGWDKPIDLLFIDSGHSYELTLLELRKYAAWVKVGGWILAHDTGEFNNIFADCRRAMLDFIDETGWRFRTMNNQNGLTIIRKYD